MKNYKNPVTFGRMMIYRQDNRDTHRTFIIQDYLHNKIVVKWCDSFEIEIIPKREFQRVDSRGNKIIEAVHDSIYDDYMKAREPTFYHEGKWYGYYGGA